MAMHLKAARVNAGLTQVDTLEAIYMATGQKIAQSTLVSWEKERTFPSVPMFKVLCTIYKVDMSDIFVPETLT